MRFIKKQLSLWRIVLIIGAAAIAIPIAARVSPTETAVVTERQDYLDHQTTADNDSKDAKAGKDSKAAVGEGVVRQQDDYYDRRREYWEKRVERRLDEEYMDEQTVDDNNADSTTKDKKDSKNAADDEADADIVDKDVEAEQDIYERRREYWRQRLEREW
jgi:hypothetical protein